MENYQYPKIALTFSGGSYRATSYDLGVLSYLNQIQIHDKSLLQCVQALSTTSGGTIVGARYAWGLKVGEPFEDIYHALYHLMGEENLSEMGIDRLITPSRAEESLESYIKAYADVYNRHFFDRGTFGAFFSDTHHSHLKYVSFNATEFTHAMPFRFQYMEGNSGIQANPYYYISDAISQQIQMGDIVAASTCFPGTYEPINFPDDFTFPDIVNDEVEELKRIKVYPNKNKYPVGLMDGGIIDNQAIMPIVDAEEYFKEVYGAEDQTNVLDLIMIVDVQDKSINSAYKPHQNEKLSTWQRLTFMQIIYIVNILGLAFTVIPFLNNFQINLKDHHISELIPIIFMVFFVGMQFFIKQKVNAFAQNINLSSNLKEPLNYFLGMKIHVVQQMLTNRLNALLTMTNEIFTAHANHSNYKLIYENTLWENRRITNALHDLDSEHLMLQNDKIPPNLRTYMPNSGIQEVVRRANAMESALYFTKPQLSTQNQESLLDTMIASGQITTCWNLLLYLGDLKKDAKNINQSHQNLQSCYDEILEDWCRFQQNPYWLVEQERQDTHP